MKNEFQLSQSRYGSNRICPLIDAVASVPAMMHKLEGVQGQSRSMEGCIYFATAGGIRCISAAGVPLWETQLLDLGDKQVFCDMVVGNKAAALAFERCFFLLDRMNGKVLYQRAYNGCYLESSVLQENALVFQVSEFGQRKLVCFDVEALAISWEVPIESYWDRLSSDDSILVASKSKSCTAYDLNTGSFLWEYKGVMDLPAFIRGTTTCEIGFSPAIWKDCVVLPIRGSYLVWLDLKSGKVVREIALPSDVNPSGSCSFLQSGKFYDLGWRFLRIDLDSGEIEVSEDLTQENLRIGFNTMGGQFAAMGKYLYVGESRKAKLLRFNMESMKFDWEYTLASPVRHESFSDGEHLFVHDLAGSLYVFSV